MRRITLALLALWMSAVSWSSAADEAAPLPPLDGVIVPRANGTLMQVKVEGVSIVLRFYDAKHVQVRPDVGGAWVRAMPAGRSPERRVLALTPDGMALTHGVPLRPPHNFKLFINLTTAGSEDAVEAYTVDYP